MGCEAYVASAVDIHIYNIYYNWSRGCSPPHEPDILRGIRATVDRDRHAWRRG